MDRSHRDLEQSRVRGILSPVKRLCDPDRHLGVDLCQPLVDVGSLANQSKAVVSLMDCHRDSFKHGWFVQSERAHVSVGVLAWVMKNEFSVSLNRERFRHQGQSSVDIMFLSSLRER